MSSPIIAIENLGKKYLISHQRSGGGLRHILNDVVSRPWAFARAGLKKRHAIELNGRSRDFASREEFWAVRNVSFGIERGEVVGIIGRNGAGKSTLLKLLSRITQPTEGRIRMKGRVASLLEVGTGFHPDLTGRENIFLNGAILGMKRPEIRRKFDDIVAFAEVERFLDTPVKRYSSGMYVRLAFAVAAHLEPEILIIDEVLAVGDAQFQKKCLGKMEAVASKEGRTVLFVSHNLAAVSSLCQRAAFLEKGRLVTIEETSGALAKYTASQRSSSYRRKGPCSDSRAAVINAAWIEIGGRSSTLNQPVALKPGSPFELVLELTVREANTMEVVASFFDHLRRPLWTFSNTSFNQRLLSSGERFELRLIYELPRLTAPLLTIDLAVGAPGVYPFVDLVHDAITCPVLSDSEGHHRNLSTDFPFIIEPAVRQSHRDVSQRATLESEMVH